MFNYKEIDDGFIMDEGNTVYNSFINDALYRPYNINRFEFYKRNLESVILYVTPRLGVGLIDLFLYDVFENYLKEYY